MQTVVSARRKGRPRNKLIKAFRAYVIRGVETSFPPRYNTIFVVIKRLYDEYGIKQYKFIREVTRHLYYNTRDLKESIKKKDGKFIFNGRVYDTYEDAVYEYVRWHFRLDSLQTKRSVVVGQREIEA